MHTYNGTIFMNRNEFHQWNAQSVSNAHFIHIHLFAVAYTVTNSLKLRVMCNCSKVTAYNMNVFR